MAESVLFVSIMLKDLLEAPVDQRAVELNNHCLSLGSVNKLFQALGRSPGARIHPLFPVQLSRQFRLSMIDFIVAALSFNDGQRKIQDVDKAIVELGLARAFFVPIIAPPIDANTLVTEAHIWETPWQRELAHQQISRWIKALPPEVIEEHMAERPFLETAGEVLEEFCGFYLMD